LGWFDGALFRLAFRRQNPQLDRAQIDRFVRDFGMNPVAKETTLRQFRKITKVEYFDGFDAMLKTIAGAVPTATLWGDGDPYVRDTRMSEQLFARKTTVLPDTGHWVPIVAAGRLAAEIRAARSQTA
jgi:pimeloyl-ACP methyl ester carboxylesterase